MTKTKMNTLLATTAVLALSACGGSGDGSATNPTVSFTAVKAFSDVAGVARGVASDGSRSVVISPDIAEVVSSANSTTQQQIDGINASDFPIVQELSTNANLREGALSFDAFPGVVMNVLAIEDLGSDSAVVLLSIPTYGNAVIASGTPLTNIPSGNFTYSGTLGTGFRSVNPQIEYGSFLLTANFNNGTFTFDGSSLSDELSGSGNVNLVNGDLSSNNITMITSGTNRTASMYGQFHGNGATGVSGVFHSNEASPVYSGAFVGSR